jgi:hypothetical protein
MQIELVFLLPVTELGGWGGGDKQDLTLLLLILLVAHG